MSPGLWLRIGAIGAIIGAVIWFVSVVRDRDRLQVVADKAAACELAVAGGLDPVASCPQAISDAATRAQRYQACDAALKADDLYTIRAACSEQVKIRDAKATALAADNAGLVRQLAEAKAAIAGAMTRANARFETILRKDRNAQAAIAKAPRAADGRVRCDARCLSELAGN